MRTFYGSCMDIGFRELQKGKPFIDALLKDLGGWYVLGKKWNATSWNFNDALKKMHKDFTSSPFYRVKVSYIDGEQSIWITEGGISHGANSRRYQQKDFEKSYKNLISSVGSYLIRDDGSETDEHKDRLENFVNDSFEIESNLAAFHFNSHYTIYYYDAYDSDYQYYDDFVIKGSLSTFTDMYPNGIDWYEQMKYLFGENNVSPHTEVQIHNQDLVFFNEMNKFISSLPQKDKARKLNNYMVWRLAETHLMTLSLDYRLAYLTFHKEINDTVLVDHSLQDECFSFIQEYMAEALNYVFIRDYFKGNNTEQLPRQQQLINMTDMLKKTAQSIVGANWMDEKTKNIAIGKLDKVVFKFGAPDWVAQQKLIDKYYRSVSLIPHDYFSNSLRLRAHRWAVIGGADAHLEHWGYPGLYYMPRIFNSGAEIMTYAGLLQAPVYSKGQPTSLAFGSLGSEMAMRLLHTIESLGHFNNNVYVFPDSSWWTKKTQDSYVKSRQCVADVYSNISKAHKIPGSPHTVVTNLNLSHAADWIITATSSVRVALKAYHKWLESGGIAEKRLPGLKLNDDQMVFLGHAQKFCFSRHRILAMLSHSNGKIEEDSLINLKLGQLSEFSDAFQCKAGSPMNHITKCTYF